MIISYVPVLHQGYLTFFRRHPESTELFLVSEELTAEIESFQKDIRALPSAEMKRAIEALGIFERVTLLGKQGFDQAAKADEHSWILPDEELMHELAQRFLAGRDVKFDSTFLRWDKKSILAEKPIVADTFLRRAEFLKEKSADWWRQVGSVLIKNGEVVAESWNHHVPSPLEPYYQGDPRASFHKGEQIELSTAIHAEAAVIAQAAKNGLSTEDTEIYATTFPCPVCAKLIAAAGIKKVSYQTGYAMLDGESILRANGVEVCKIVL